MRAQSEARSPRRRGERAGRPGCRQHATANGRMLSPRVAIHPIGPIILRTAHARAQDVEFCVRARKHDVPLTFCAGAVVAHAFNPGLRGLFRQFLRYGLFERQMCARHPEYLSWLSITTEISSFDVRLAEAAPRRACGRTVARQARPARTPRPWRDTPRAESRHSPAQDPTGSWHSCHSTRAGEAPCARMAAGRGAGRSARALRRPCSEQAPQGGSGAAQARLACHVHVSETHPVGSSGRGPHAVGLNEASRSPCVRPETPAFCSLRHPGACGAGPPPDLAEVA